MQKQFFLLTFISLICFSCKQKLHFEGDSMTNYPDMKMIFRENLEPFQKSPYTFKLITIENEKKDSSLLKAQEVDWDRLTRPFLKANIFREELDGHYQIDLMTDTTLGKLTLLLTSLDPTAITSKMSVTARTVDNKIMTVYMEARNAGIFTTSVYKLLFVNEKTLQVQERKTTLFSKPKTKIMTLTFMN